MRVWIGAQPNELRQLVETGSLQSTGGFAVTPAWRKAMDEDELEVLEDLIREQCGTPVVLVAQVDAEVLPGDSGAVQIQGSVTTRLLLAVFVRLGPDDEYSWFGPTELLSATEFLGS